MENNYQVSQLMINVIVDPILTTKRRAMQLKLKGLIWVWDHDILNNLFLQKWFSAILGYNLETEEVPLLKYQ